MSVMIVIQYEMDHFINLREMKRSSGECQFEIGDRKLGSRSSVISERSRNVFSTGGKTGPRKRSISRQRLTAAI